MATLGLRDLFYAIITEDENGNETFGTPKRLAKAIKVELSVNVAEGILYADDAIDEVVKQFTDGTIKLNTNDLSSESSSEITGQKIDGNNITFATEKDEPPYVAIGFRAMKTGGKFRYVWLHKVKFAIPSENYETKGDSINFITPEIEGTFGKLNKNGVWKCDYTGVETDDIAKTWFNSVKEPIDTTEPIEE